MKSKLSIKLILALTFIFGAVFVFTWIYSKNKSITDLYEAYLIHAEAQNKTERKWLNIDSKLERTDSTSFLSPAFITSIDDGFFYVVDLGAMNVKKIDEASNIVQIFGEGQGRGPGELLSVRSIRINKNGQIWIADERNGRIIIFEQDGTWKKLHPRTMSSGVSPLSKDKYVLASRFDSQLFITSLSDNTPIMTSQLLNKEGALWAYVLQPLIIKADSISFLRINMHTNDFVKYDKKGNVIYFRKNINDMQLNDLKIDPPKRYSDNQDIKFNEVSLYSYTPRSLDVQVLNQQIHILTSAFDKQYEIVNIIDVYDLKTGDYKFSYQLPESLYGFAISNNYIAGITRSEQVLKIWKTNSIWRYHEGSEL